MDVVTTVIVSALAILFLLWFTMKQRVGRPLKGPTGLPFLGYLPFITTKPYVKFQQLAETYGPLYSVKLGSKEIVILCDFNLIKEAFAHDAFMGRPADLPFDLNEVTIQNGAMLEMPWKEQRRFSMHILRDLGFGKTRMEEQLTEEILELLELMKKHVNTSIKITEFLTPSTSNNIASLICGKRMKFDDPKRKKLDKLLREVGQLAGSVGWQIFFPWIGTFMSYFKIGKKKDLSRALLEFKLYMREEIREHESTLDPNNIRDFLDAYLIEIEKRKSDINTTFRKEVLEDICNAFFGAGSETVRITVEWILLVCAAFPQVQKKIHHEIDEVLGRERFPSWPDHVSTPYTEAAILELMRWRTIVPLNIMRSTLKDTELNGYFIPKNTPVLAILWAIDHDKRLWGNDVEVYRPERFLSKDGDKVVKPDHFIPFSIGKRSCPGKTLAEIETYLYVTAILQKFKLSIPVGKEPNFDGILGIGLQPKAQEIYLELR